MVRIYCYDREIGTVNVEGGKVKYGGSNPDAVQCLVESIMRKTGSDALDVEDAVLSRLGTHGVVNAERVQS